MSSADLTTNSTTTEPQTIRDTPNPTPEQTPATQQNPTQPITQIDFPPPILTPQPAITPRQQTALSLLLAGHTASAVAALLGLNRCTITQWRRLPAFAAEFARRQREIRNAADQRLRLLVLRSTHAALDSLKAKDDQDRWRNSFRVLALMRPYIPMLNQPTPNLPGDDDLDDVPLNPNALDVACGFTDQPAPDPQNSPDPNPPFPDKV